MWLKQRQKTIEDKMDNIRSSVAETLTRIGSRRSPLSFQCPPFALVSIPAYGLGHLGLSWPSIDWSGSTQPLCQCATSTAALAIVTLGRDDWTGVGFQNRYIHQCHFVLRAPTITATETIGEHPNGTPPLHPYLQLFGGPSAP